MFDLSAISNSHISIYHHHCIQFENFDKIVQLRYGHVVAESTYSELAYEIYATAFGTVSDELSEETNSLTVEIIRFAKSLHLQKAYLKSLGGFLEPVACSVGNIKYQYISITDVASMVLNNRSLIREIFREKNQKFSNQIHEYSGELTCAYIRWHIINGTFRIQIYTDEFSIVNPIGHSKHNQNYLVVYCTFTNIPYKDRLKRSDLFLLLIVNHKEIDPQILHDVFDKLKTEVNNLVSNGVVKYLTNGSKIKIPCALSSIVGDAKSAYQLTGYPDTFSLGFRCRFCGANHDEIQCGLLNRPLFGTEYDIKEYWKIVEKAEGIVLPEEDQMRKNFGLKRKFIFASQDLSRPIDPWGICPPDICHDTLEGAFPRIGSIILITLTKTYLRNKDQMLKIIKKKQFYNAEFRIKSVTGGFAIEGDMIQRAEFLIRLEHILLEDLPIEAGVSAEEIMNSKPFLLYLAIKEICIISFQTSITETDLNNLTEKIKEMFLYVNELDPKPPNQKNKKSSITPKMHHISHYPELIRKFGPLIYFSSLPGERKHQFFKQWARVMHNMINAPLSLAVRHQCYQAATFKAKLYSECNFDFEKKLVINPEIIDVVSDDAKVLRGVKTPCHLNKDVMRRIGTSNTWIQINSFWQIPSTKEIFVGGPVFEKSSNKELSFSILIKKFDMSYIRYEDLYHVN